MLGEASEDNLVRRVPLDVFAPSDDGQKGYPLEEVVAIGWEAVEAVDEAVDRFKDALIGCMTPLNLTKMIDELRWHASAIRDVARHMGYARSIVEEARPLARVLGPHDQPWTGPQGLEVALTPKQLMRARRLAREVDEADLTSYRAAVLARPGAVPTLEARKREQRTEEDLIDVLLADMVARACAKCDAAAGEYCITSTGRRADIPHAARRDASPRMKGCESHYLNVKQPQP